MAELTLTLRGRQYAMACDDNEVDRVKQLAEYVDKKLEMVAGSSGIKNESHLLVLTALVLADEVMDAKKGIMPKELSDREEKLDSILDSITGRLTNLSHKIDRKRA